MLDHIFSSLGFSAEESQTYLTLLESGPVTAGALAKKMGAPRPSVYGFLNKLVEKGAVTQTAKDGVMVFVAQSPQAIAALFRDKIEDLESMRRKFEDLIPALEKKIALDFMRPKFEFFEGRDNIQNVLKDILLYSGIETFTFWPIKAMISALSPEFFYYHNKTRIQNRVSIRALWPRDQAVEIKDHPYLGSGKEYLREIRILPPDISFSMGYWGYKNKVAFLSSSSENFGFIVESAEMAAMMKVQHDALWQVSEKIKVNPEDMEPFIRDLKKKT